MSKIGIIHIASSLPTTKMTAKEVALLSNTTEEIITRELGFTEKPVAQADEHPSHFALNAANKVLAAAHIQASEIDFIIYGSNGLYDYQFWSPAAHIQNELKASHAISFEINNGCNAANAGLFMAKHLLLNPLFKYGMVIVSDTLSKFVDYKDPHSFPLLSFSDGASALLIGNHHSNIILSQALYTDGSFVECNKLILGGTKGLEARQDGHAYFTVDYHHPKTIELRDSAMAANYIKVIMQALSDANIEISEISHFLINNNSKSIINKIIDELNIPAHKLHSIREHHGHVGAIDALLSFEQCLKHGRFKKDDIVMLASTGIGYHWGAQVIKI